jgi:hypothetical protein
MKSEYKNLTMLSKHFTQIQEAARAFRVQFTPLFANIHERIQVSMQPIFEAQERLQKSLKPIVEAQQRVADIAERLTSAVEPILKFRRQIESIVSPAFQELIKNFDNLPERTRNVLLLLGQHGWFLDLESPIPKIWKLEKVLKSGDIENVEDVLIEYYRESSSEIAEKLKKNYPNRATILDKAFIAHSRGEYELSIPVFLIQADGICQELINVQLFTKRENKPLTAAYVETIANDTLQFALLYPLAHPLPISASAHERGVDFDQLNRHQVLHGESLDYGTEVNSLKAISLLNYVANILERDESDTHQP